MTNQLVGYPDYPNETPESLRATLEFFGYRTTGLSDEQLVLQADLAAAAIQAVETADTN